LLPLIRVLRDYHAAAVADLADHEHTSAPSRELEHLSSDAGGKLLRALGVKGHEAELRSASDEFSGHCLALTLLGSYLTDAFNGNIRCRKEVICKFIWRQIALQLFILG
jgi:hypothetical protein